MDGATRPKFHIARRKLYLLLWLASEVGQGQSSTTHAKGRNDDNFLV